MIEAWFPQEIGPWFSMLSLLALLSLLKPFARRGRHRAVVISIYGACIVVGGALLAAAAFATLVGQPAHVIRPLALGGVIVTLIFAGAFANLRRVYTEAELRKTVAGDM